MKIQGKDLKVGMKIKDGIWSMDIKSIRKDTQKNGTSLIIPSGLTSRKNSKNNRRRLGEFVYQDLETERVYKELTFITVE